MQAAGPQISPLVPLRSRTTVQAGRERVRVTKSSRRAIPATTSECGLTELLFLQFSVGHSLVSEKEVFLFDLKEVISQRRHPNGAVSIQKSPEDGRPRVCFSVPSDLPPFQGFLVDIDNPDLETRPTRPRPQRTHLT
ncbi:hypothetical protein QC762_0047680 [Podospora pseudocomata]|uniref:Uncharacterized protein n=1 Tax=Podospora pseudocomata TaxID=2093779 RepID=A0ABR0GHI5_9PEZI|nr:hypothetical protein QC762_0047680 [Podospora pseudocomata]